MNENAFEEVEWLGSFKNGQMMASKFVQASSSSSSFNVPSFPLLGSDVIRVASTVSTLYQLWIF